jgi:hypothetical protein
VIMAGPQPTLHSPAVMEQYESLRTAMLGEVLLPDSRTGLIVLLHRGMWAWARSIVLDSAGQISIPTSSADPSRLERPCERRAVVHLLASMAMTITDRRSA